MKSKVNLAVLLHLLPALLALVVAARQVVVHSQGTLSPWKGGGFGMYTTPHPFNSRVLWIEAPEVSRFTIAPAGPDFITALRKEPAEVQRRASRFLAAAHRARPFPDGRSRAALLDSYARLFPQLSGPLQDRLPTPESDLRVLAAERIFDVQSGSYTLRLLPP